MLCAMCFGPCDQFNADVPLAQCVNCRLFFHQECTYLKREKQENFTKATWLCNQCRRRRLNTFSKNQYNKTIFGVEPDHSFVETKKDTFHASSLFNRITTNNIMTLEHQKSIHNIISRLHEDTYYAYF